MEDTAHPGLDHQHGAHDLDRGSLQSKVHRGEADHLPVHVVAVEGRRLELAPLCVIESIAIGAFEGLALQFRYLAAFRGRTC